MRDMQSRDISTPFLLYLYRPASLDRQINQAIDFLCYQVMSPSRSRPSCILTATARRRPINHGQKHGKHRGPCEAMSLAPVVVRPYVERVAHVFVDEVF